MSSLDRYVLVMTPVAGSESAACERDAVEVAATEKINVEYTFNGHRYRVEYMDLLRQVKMCGPSHQPAEAT